MKKNTHAKKESARPPAKTDVVTTSVVFKRGNLDFLRAFAHDRDLSVSWAINKVVEKLRAGAFSIEID